MFTSIDKAIVALIMAALSIANLFTGHEWINEDTAAWIIAVATPILVWAVPNKE